MNYSYAVMYDFNTIILFQICISSHIVVLFKKVLSESKGRDGSDLLKVAKVGLVCMMIITYDDYYLSPPIKSKER